MPKTLNACLMDPKLVKLVVRFMLKVDLISYLLSTNADAADSNSSTLV